MKAIEWQDVQNAVVDVQWLNEMLTMIAPAPTTALISPANSKRRL